MIKNLFYILIVFVNCQITFASTDVFTDFSKRIDHVSKRGVSDLVLKFKFPNLTKALKSSYKIDNISELVFTVYWIKSNETRITVSGLNGNFQQIRAAVINRVKPIVELMLPKDLLDTLSEFTFKKLDSKKNKNVYMGLFNKVKSERHLLIYFNKSGELEKIQNMLPNGAVASEQRFKYSKRSFTEGNYLLEEMVRESKTDSSSVKSIFSLEYDIETKFMKKITIDSVSIQEQFDTKTKKKKYIKNEMKDEIEIIEVMINKGISKKYINNN